MDFLQPYTKKTDNGELKMNVIGILLVCASINTLAGPLKGCKEYKEAFESESICKEAVAEALVKRPAVSMIPINVQGVCMVDGEPV